LTLSSEAPSWKNALKLDLSHHKDYFNSDAYKEDAKSYTQELRDLVEEIRNDAGEHP
jgi:hypothetical protein